MSFNQSVLHKKATACTVFFTVYCNCSDALRRGQKYTKISLDDIRSYDAQLAQDVADDPAEYLPLVITPL